MSLSLVSHTNSKKSSYGRHDVRLISSIDGRYGLPQRRPEHGRKIQVFQARLRSISTRHIVIHGPTQGDEGEWAVFHFDELGLFRGIIHRRLETGLMANLVLSAAEIEVLGRKIDWLKRHYNEQVPDQRRHKRILARQPYSCVIFSNGHTMPCRILNMSQSGVAVAFNGAPEIGTPLAIGTVVGRVVRHFENGFAIKFLVEQQSELLEEALQPPHVQQFGDLMITETEKIHARA